MTEPHVGAPVRVLTEGCQERWRPNPRGVSIRGHIPAINGKRGIVTGDHRLCTETMCIVHFEGRPDDDHGPCLGIESHPWEVEFERAIVLPTGHRITSAYFADREIEPALLS